MPDVGAGAPLTIEWWLAMIVLAAVTGGGAAVYGAFSHWLSSRIQAARARSEAEEKHADKMDALDREFRACKLACSEHRADFVSRREFEARMDKIENKFELWMKDLRDQIGRIAEKLGLV